MRKSTLSMALIAMSVCLAINPPGAFAQTDSAWLDAGTLKFNKGFTQYISIKGEDLEKMPFTNLAEAINVWLYGSYTNASTLHYVVDGVPLGDVNAYSVYDIEEVILIQNALAQVNGVYRDQQLVIVRTRRNEGKRLTLAAQTGLASRDYGQDKTGKSYPSDVNAYQHYFAGLHQTAGNIRVGISADYTQDVLPSVKADSVHTVTPFTMKRWQLNGWLDARLGAHNQITVQANYCPQQLDSAQHYISRNYFDTASVYQETRQSEDIINPSVTWHSQFGKGWNNDLQFGYLSWSGKGAAQLQSLGSLQPQNLYLNSGDGHVSSEHYVARERLSYTLAAGRWAIIPSVNFSYEHVKETGSENITEGISGSPLSTGTYTFQAHGKVEQLTPGLQVLYKDAMSIEGGLLANLSHSYISGFAGKAVNRSFPFVSFTTNPFAWQHRTRRPDLKLFFSYASSPTLAITDYSLSGLTTPGSLSSMQLLPGQSSSISFGGSGLNGLQSIASYDIALNTRYWQWDAGANFSTPDGRWQINYHYERQKFTSPVTAPSYLGTVVLYPIFGSSLHSLQVMARVAQSDDFDWQSGLSVATIHVSANLSNAQVTNYFVTDLNAGKPSWTGGWVNRFRWGALSAGADILYHLHEGANFYTGNFPLPAHTWTNSLLMQNIYLGYCLGMGHDRALELYFDSRGLFRSGKPDLQDGRRYFGIGGKFMI